MSKGLSAQLDFRHLRPPPEGSTAGQGIVTCAGGTQLFTCAYILVRILRETLGCDLPIQLWHFGGEELSPVMRRLLLRHQVELVDATAMLSRYPADIHDGWQLKVYAILYSRFDEVLFLDADQVPVRDPRFLFGAEEYLRSGAVFWPDIVDLAVENPVWAWAGLQPEACASWESGQILVDKRRHWPALLTTLLLNEQAGVVYEMLYGDKDTFLIAWRLAKASAEVVPHRPFCDHRILVQRDFQGAPLFQHRTNSKWTYHQQQYELDGFVHMDACLGYLEHLRSTWNGRLFFPPDRSPAARAEEDRLERVSGLRLALLGDSEGPLTLLEGHQIGDGRSVDRQNWYVVETLSGLELHIHNGQRITYRLLSGPAGQWEGERCGDPPNQARLDETRLLTAPTGEAWVAGLLAALLDSAGFHAVGGAGESLVDALGLLMRAEPGFLAALEELAKNNSDLIPLFNKLRESAAGERIRPVDKTMAGPVLSRGYTPARDGG